MEYTNITFENLLSNFKTNLTADNHFKHINSATIFGMYMEMLAASTDMTIFNMQRGLEELFFKTARNYSSYIKLCKTFGYSLQRPVPAQTTLNIVLKGPFPKEFKEAQNIQIDFTNELFNLSYLGNPFILEGKYSYIFNDTDKKQCTDPTWRKTLRSASKIDKNPYNVLQKVDPTLNNSIAIKCFQGEEKLVEFNGKDVYDKIMKSYNKKDLNVKYYDNDQIYNEHFDHAGQYYDINDITFSNWYSYRDPFAYKDNIYSADKGITKVIVAKSKDIALSEHIIYSDGSENYKLFDIEDSSIFLNKSLIDNDNIPNKPYNICSITTNEDKTVRISFSPLKYLTNNGINTITDDSTLNFNNLYVKYLSTVGAAANKIGVRDSVMRHTNNVYVIVDGKIYDITNNIEFIISNDITGGKNFESKESMKDNAISSYYSSMMKLISKRDFIDYFSSLTKPIDVKTALVFSQSNLDNTEEISELDTNNTNNSSILEVRQNTICYSLVSDLYKIKKTNGIPTYYPVNLLMSKKDFNNNWPFDYCIPENNDDAVTLYCDEYPEHITDYLKLLVSPGGFYTKYHNIKPSNTQNNTQSEQNIYGINSSIENACTSNTILYSLPPFMQYFDIVGNVRVKSLTKDIDAYKIRTSNKIYKFLNENSNISREIYKSDIIKIYMEDPDTEMVDIDIKVSSMLSPVFTTYKFGSYQNVIIQKNIQLDPELNNNIFGFNEIIIPKYDYNTTLITDDIINTNLISCIQLYINGVNESIELFDIPCTISKIDENYKITLHQSYIDKTLNYSLNNNVIQVNSMNLTTVNKDNYYTLSNFKLVNSPDYGLPSNFNIGHVNDEIKKWIDNLYIHNQADRVINLPYTVKTNNIVTRNETIERKGNIGNTSEDTLSEFTFWNYFAKKIISKGYSSTIDESTDIDNQTWQQASKLIIDIYKLFKAGIADSILDDNNNIVNFSTDMDIAVLCNKVNVSYK